ncbi:MAG TPA: hypothetical protein PK306_10220 [Aquabacterium sp.]|nr:hypothetical protein [Aquabacterium sp.]HQC96070.1 hypothetical protein [Aquabacterium sp.]
MLQRLVLLLRRAGGALLALLILFEEWGWEPLQRALARLGRLPLLRQLEAWIARLPPHAALVVFVVPALLLLPVKLAALALIAHGQRLLGLAVIVAAKLVGTAIVARLFTLTRPALMQLPWFERLYGRWTAWKEALLARVRASWAWRWGRVVKRQARQQWARWMASS